MGEPHYELVELLGQGGMGSVYRAFHRPTGRAVAIKTLHTATKSREDGTRILLDEATSAAKLDDRRIVRLLDVGRERDNTPFLVMELARGVSLDRMIESWAGWTSLSKAVLDVLAGLRVAHSAGIIHRDLKPGNVIVDPEDGVARVLDFGIAKRFDPLKLDDDVPGEEILGTPEYMPPEQMMGEATGAWTDLYAIGVILAEIVRGESPFRYFESLYDLVFRKQTYTGKHVCRPGLVVPDGLQRLIDRLLAPLPQQRPRFAGEVAGLLEGLARHVEDNVTDIRKDEPDPRQAFIDLHGGAPPPEPLIGEVLPLPCRLPADEADPQLRSSLIRLKELRLIGRRSEREELMSMVHDVVQDGRPRLLVYSGEPGIGKSRLARWGMSYVERVGAMEGAAGGYDIAGADVAGGLRHALRRVVGTPPSARNQLGWSWLRDPELDHDRLAQYLRADLNSEVMGVDLVVQMAHAALRGAGRLRPIYMWLDDLAWARDGAMELVQRILEAGDVPILFVATIRSGTSSHDALREQVAQMTKHPDAHVRELRLLKMSERVELIRETAKLSKDVAEQIATNVEGSPLLLVQLTQDWLERGLLVPSGDVFDTEGDSTVSHLLDARPIAALIQDRVDGILHGFGTLPAQKILGRAALLGARFDLVALQAACKRDGRLGDCVSEVMDHALLVGLLRSEGEDVYSFDHGMVRDALLERVASDQRAFVDAANGLLKRYGKARTDIAAVVADLLHRAGDYDRAWERLLGAISRSAWSGDDGQAKRHLARAKKWLAIEPDRTPMAELAEADVHYYALRYDEALAAVRRARASTPDQLLLARCDAHEADILFYMGRLTETEAIATRSLADNEDSPDPDRIAIAARAATRLAQLAGLLGELETERAYHEYATNFSRRSGDAFRTRIGRLNVAEVRALLGETDWAIREVEDVKREALAARDEAATMGADETLLHIYVLAGQMDRARTDVRKRRAVTMTRGDKWRITAAIVYCALVAENDAELEGETTLFLDAWAEVPHDESATVAAMEQLIVRLAARGLNGLAQELKASLSERLDRIRRGFASLDESS